MIGMFSARYIILFFYSLRVFNLIGQKKILLVILVRFFQQLRHINFLLKIENWNAVY
ncbi:hypothetical protein RhiirA5_105077 [Rhizophagus irregularis]|uniref:Uncharacterized protein n=2 Tax=Rhizophagus irregularis TaxID=588596 RepID=A0A2N0PZ05_9GLOM|nr:hypothetical protein GLOIN_2v1593488 [Rhizophagus irregularis DAOM 181602=DAOM 197198]PKC12070.1 hypothetical protein RhiirA5_105077 [Rhizophagus irregularis]POG72618.1 hypothetical protein GLOIN_2v1593488 [Rhizophagus irregularis DAOM 181602=DAOM 197198]GET63680.1 hypothetical protein GLOIN_2v1593488 [Rhizophagus irregularis DAOM 181602=DAOM 197198]|eukprot:XP_025179484.1 hypothetical protein GLOIN_2v1593488 [Rhizophagus irregularis DAOM 181602=DAOM 197198]